MKVYGFSVTFADQRGQTTFEEVAEYLGTLQLAQRHFGGMRLENVTRAGSVVKLDFSRLRDAVLPGKATRTTPTTSLGLLAGEAVSEETAAIYIPQTGTLAVQFNLFGPHKGSIENYMNYFAPIAARSLGKATAGAGEGFSIAPYINQNVQAQFARMQLFKKLEMKVATTPVNQNQRAAGMSLGSVVDMGLAGGTEVAHVVLTAGRAKSASLDRNFIRDALDYLQRHTTGVEKLRVSAKEHIDSDVEILDLVDAVLKHEIDVAIGQDRRYPRFARWGAIESVLQHWANNRLIP